MRSTLKRKPAGTGTVTAPQRPRLDPRPCAHAAFHGEAGSAPKMALRVLGRGPGARSMAQRPPRKTRRELGEGSEGLTGRGAVCRCAQACTSDVRRSSWPSGCTEQPWERKQARRRAAGQRRAAGAQSPRGVRAPAGPPRICARACVRVMRCWRPRMDQEGRSSGRSLRTRRPALGRPGRLCQRTARAPAARPPVGRDRCPSAHGVLPQGEHGAPRQLLARLRSAEGPTCRAEVDTAVRGGVLRWHLRTLITATATLDHGSTWPGGDDRGLRGVALPLLT